MTILPIEAVVALQPGETISGLVGTIEYVGTPETRPGRLEESQLVTVANGAAKIALSISNPHEHGGPVGMHLKGHRLYAWYGQDGRGKWGGLTRGKTVAQVKYPGQFTNYVNLNGAAMWGMADPNSNPHAPNSQHAPAPPDDIPMQYGTPPTQPYLANRLPHAPVHQPGLPVPYVPAVIHQGPMQILPPTFASVVTHHQQCLAAALQTALQFQDQVAGLTGAGWSDGAIASMAATIYIECNKKNASW